MTELDQAVTALPDDIDGATIRRVALEQSRLTRRRVKAAFAESVTSALAESVDPA